MPTAGTKPPSPPGPEPRHLSTRQRWQRQLEVTRRARRQRNALTLVGLLSVATLLLTGLAWASAGYITSRLGRLDAAVSGTPDSGPVNILVVGVDSRAGLTRRQQLEFGVGAASGTNTDTMMVVHVPADHRSAQVVSLPRDSWVEVPGHGMNKINSALALGGPKLMVRTVERATGLNINDYAAISFIGFIRVVDALGGVSICLPTAVDDPQSGLNLPAGRHHVDGITALKFARDRHSFATSDLARIGNQQQLMSSMLTRATQTGVLANPVRLQQVVSAGTSAVQVDRGFNLTELASQLRGLTPSDVSFATVPVATTNYRTPTGESAVLWDGTAARELFRELRHGRLAPRSARPAAAGGAAGSPPRDTVAGGSRTAAQDACR